MNIFKKALIVALSVGLISVPSVTKEVDAADVTWSLAGTMNGWSASDTTYDLKYDETDQRYEIVITFSANAEFKIVKNHNWNFSIGWSDYSKDQGKSDYLSNSGGNFKVKAAGDYLIYFYDKTSSSYTPWAGDVGIETYSVSKHSITYHLETLITEEYSDGQVWNSKFVEKEGYRLAGWYTDSGFTTEFKKGSKVTTDLNLYPKYVEASDYTIFASFDSSFGNTVYAYMWRDTLDGAADVEWPGTEMTKVRDNLYAFTVDASKSYSKIIFNNGSSQTDDLDLSLSTIKYNVAENLTVTTSTIYDSFDVVTAELGFGYTYDSETNVLQDVTYANLRFSTPSLVATNFDVDTYGMNITLCTAEEDLIITKEWTNEDVVKSGDNISWSAVVMNIPSTYFTTTIKVECFVKVGTYSFVISNTREVTVAGLAKTYIDRHNDQNDKLVLSSFELAGCQKIVGTNAAN